MSLSSFNLDIVIDQPQTGVSALYARCDLSKGQIKDAMQKGAVWLRRDGRAQRLRRAKRQLRAGDALSLYYNEAILKLEPARPQLLRDEQNYSLWYKPAGLMATGSRYADHHSILRQVELALHRPTLLVHRLDRFTRGVMLLAHSKKTAAALSKQFSDRVVQKIYQAEVVGSMDQSRTVELSVNGKPAVSHIRPLQTNADRTIVEVQIETGRKHQIRTHLAAIGYPIVGDRKAGQGERDLQLVAVRLCFVCPDSEQSVECALEPELRLL